ncbi:DUF5686 and carboxypeptidase regulatory-like domain-containing protein [Leptobacterium sp. I13]|uniref:DUF5686 and carboxypeptidase regulatory-like domain-containing protein n=1 Tax=Leptobacterium meishanense TaxID=3128904 RepID=UPI0030EEB409
MIRYLLFILLTGCLSIKTSAQVTGIVTDEKNNPLPYVNIYLKNTSTGTTTNDSGQYELNINKEGSYHIVFQYLGFETLIKEMTIKKFPFVLNAVLIPETISLNEVVLSANENPANEIMRKVIAKRKENLDKLNQYTADFYSKGIYRLKNAPEKILGQDLGDFGGGLDSTRSGIIYLSETKSKLTYKKPFPLKEKIIASKLSGNDNGFSFNSASDVNFSFYQNTINFNTELISPIADYAFNYYTYQLEGTFYDDRNNLINKIRVAPKRSKDRVGEGFLYIVEDQWALYGVEFKLTGQQVQIPVIETIAFKQNYTYSETIDSWLLISQVFNIEFGFFGIEGNGSFTAAYSNYSFDSIDDAVFTRALVSFEKEANKKGDDFWNKIRPIPLTIEEIDDYVKKDSVQIIRKSKQYLDSIDKKNNGFSLTNLLFGYTYKNSHKNWNVRVEPPLFATQYNSVQGWHSTAGISFFKSYEEKGRWLNIDTHFNYGFSDERFRVSGAVSYKFNNFSRPIISLSGGGKVAQFNESEPIPQTVNSIRTLVLERNFMKVFEKNYIQLDFANELFNGFRLYTSLGYEKRNPLFNTITQDRFTSNNPLLPNDFDSPAFESHHIFKTSITGRIRFKQNYLDYPDAKYNLPSNYPTLYLTYEGGFGASEQKLNFSQIRARISHNFNIANKGTFSYKLKAGSFLNTDELSFIDFQHFNGNETNVGSTRNYLNNFNLLPYYALSTNDSYFEGHIEHDFKGYVLGKLPLINQLNFNLIAGVHVLTTSNNKPYSEFAIGIDNLGWGKFRFLRLDYMRSYQNGFLQDGLIFGLKFLDLF